MNAKPTTNLATATFAGGCFWCMEPGYQERKDVIDAVVGYTGGERENPSYEEVSTGTIGHREAVQVTYDPSQVSYEELLNVFWQQIDPTDAGGQFADRGSQYKTAIYYHDDEQKKLAEQSKKTLEESGKFDKPIMTEILPFENFYKAEDAHQDYYKKQTAHYNSYKKGSGREDFIHEQWSHE